MEETKISRNDHDGNKKMVSKSGGGIGSVLLLGGALATAALASAFAVRQKRRSSGGDHTRNSSPDINKKMEDTRKEAKEEVGMGNVIICDESLKMDDKGKVESDGDGFVMIKDEKESVELIKEDVSSNSQDNGVGGVEVSLEKKELEVLCNGNGEINEEKCVEKTIMPRKDTHEGYGEEEAIEEEHQDSYEFEAEEAKQIDLVDDSSEVKEDQITLGNSMQKKDAEKGVDDEEEEQEEHCIDDEEKEGPVDSSNWKPHQQAKLIKYETGGKMIEDRLVDEGEGVKYQTNSSRRRMIILTLSVLSSLSCSCLFNLSSANLCLVGFFTVFLLEIYGYSLLNHAAKGDGSYEQISELKGQEKKFAI